MASAARGGQRWASAMAEWPDVRRGRRWFTFAGRETLDNGLALVLHLGPRRRRPDFLLQPAGGPDGHPWAATSTRSGASGQRDAYTACSKSAYICSAGGVTNGRNCE